MNARYDKMTTDDFDRILFEVVSDESAASLLAIPGVYEILSEHFNNAVLEAWELQQQQREDAEDVG